MADIQQRVACKAVIIRNGRILLLRESSIHDTNFKAGQYQFPGGRVEPGEPFLTGLSREVREETGLEITSNEPFFVGEWFPIVKGVPHQIVGVFFLCNDDGGEIVLSEEHDDYTWVDTENLESIKIMTPDDQVVQKYFSQKG